MNKYIQVRCYLYKVFYNVITMSVGVVFIKNWFSLLRVCWCHFWHTVMSSESVGSVIKPNNSVIFVTWLCRQSLLVAY